MSPTGARNNSAKLMPGRDLVVLDVTVPVRRLICAAWRVKFGGYYLPHIQIMSALIVRLTFPMSALIF